MIETMSAIATVCFAVTLLIIINGAKKKNLNAVKSAMTNPLWPRTKLSTVYYFYRLYYISQGLKLVLILNILSFCVTILGLTLIIIDY